MHGNERGGYDDVEHRPQGGAGRFIPAILVAGFSFLLTTVVWRLVHQTRAVEAAVQESIVQVQRYGAASGEEAARLREELSRQVSATARLEERLAEKLVAVETTAAASLDRMHALAGELARHWTVADQLRQEIGRATAGIAQARQEIIERMAVHADRSASARDGLIRDVTAAIGQMERTLLAQVEDFQKQKQQIDAAAERDRATRRALLNEAMQAFTVQVDGLREILDGLKVEADAVDDRGSSADALGIAPATPAADAAVTGDVGASGGGDAGRSHREETPATAARDAGTAIE